MRRHASIQDKLDAVFERSKSIDIRELELRADFARHLCVLVSGFLEQSIKIFTIEYVRKRSTPEVTRHVTRSIKNLTNLKTEKITQHLLSFNQEWQSKIVAILSDERKAAIDSVISLRHSISHGQPDDVTLARIENYYREIIKAVEDIRAIMDID